MNREAFITCAVTGDDRKVKNNPHCPVSPEQIARSALEAAAAGAAIVHIHVRDPQTGDFSMATAHYREVVKRIREENPEVIVNLTAGVGGFLFVGDDGLANTPAEGTDLVSQEERLRHVIELVGEGKYRPDIATLDCGTLNFGDGNRTYISPPSYIRKGAEILRDLKVRPELEIFDTGNLSFVRDLAARGYLDSPYLIQLCMGIAYGMPAEPGHLLALVNHLPQPCLWSSFAIGRMQMPWVAQSILAGGNVRVGLEDNLYLSRGVFATNAQLVERARSIIEAMGASVLGPAQVRDRLELH